MSSPRRAIVFSGGGARGAYEAGVLRYVLEVVPEELGRPVDFDVICGTSVGAINASWLAATLHEPAYCVQRLWYLWRTLSFSQVVRPSLPSIWEGMRRLFGFETTISKLGEHIGEDRHGGILNTSFFDNLIRSELPADNIERNLAHGLLDALAVSATSIATGQTVVFAQTASKEIPPWTRDPRRIVVGGPITADKVLASAAIPFLFPPVKIGHQWFCDGGVRQNTPLSPALRLGAERVLVIALRSRRRSQPPGPFDVPEDAPAAPLPTPGMMAGKLLDALLLDPIDYDLKILERINGILSHGEQLFGDDSFTDALNEVVHSYRGQEYHVVEPLLLRPSQDLGRLASDFADQVSDEFWGSRLVASVGRAAAERDGNRESDLLSYLLFDGGYTGQLLDMGYSDAAEIHDQLVAFFRDE